MTPSQERQVMKNIKDLLDANALMDAKQEKDIKALDKRVTALEADAIAKVTRVPKYGK